jgi:hypothetical protein
VYLFHAFSLFFHPVVIYGGEGCAWQFEVFKIALAHCSTLIDNLGSCSRLEMSFSRLFPMDLHVIKEQVEG